MDMRKNTVFTLMVCTFVILLVIFFANSQKYNLYKFGSNFSLSKYILMYETGINFKESTTEYNKTIAESSFIPNFSQIVANPLSDLEDFEYETKSTFDIKNNTDKIIDVDELLTNPYDLGIELDSNEPQVLVFHTHGTESYAKLDTDTYEESGDARTLDYDYNISVIARTLTNSLNSAGIYTLYSDEIHDYPSYVQSYSNSLVTVSDYLAKYPSIKLVIDVHRDAIVTGDGVHHKETVTINGEEASKVMVVIGSNGSGLDHENYMTNLNVGANIHNTINSKYDGLMRNLFFSNSRYNQHLSVGQILVEIGYSGNTLDEAKAGIKYFAHGLIDYITKE